jgi:hypothetical protein
MDTTPVRMFFEGLRRFVPELTFAEVRRDEEIEGGDSVIARGATPLAGHAEPAHAASSEIARGDIDDVVAERRVVPSSVIPASWNASSIARLLAAASPRVHRCCERNCLDSIEHRYPGWLESTKSRVKELKKSARNGSSVLRRALGEPRRSRGGVEYSTRFKREAQSIQPFLEDHGACMGALLRIFFTKIRLRNVKTPEMVVVDRQLFFRTRARSEDLLS